jgi:hypothetical protein
MPPPPANDSGRRWGCHPRKMGRRCSRARLTFVGRLPLANFVFAILGRVLLGAFVSFSSAFAAELAPAKKLWGKKRSEAVAARNRADLMRADYEKGVSATRKTTGQGGAPGQRPIDPEAAKVVRAYQEVIDQYPHTEIAAYCAFRLSGLYQFLRHFDKAAELTERVANEFAGTLEGKRAALEMGLIQADGLHDPAEAAKWFSRIPKPATPTGADDDTLFLSAQEGLVKCELALGKGAQAKERVDSLRQEFPKYADEISRFYQFEVDSRKGADARLPDPKTSPTSLRRNINAYACTGAVSALMVLTALFIHRQLRKKRRTP